MSNELKESPISFRCTEEEKMMIKSKASRAGFSMSNFIVQACLNSDVNNDSQKIVEILEYFQFLLNQLENKELKKGRFIKKMKKEMERTWQNL